MSDGYLTKSYKELSQLKTFEERFEYLKLKGSIGKDTFGFDRYLNQMFYKSKEWSTIRDRIIVRDNGCDLGIADRPIYGRIYIHHITPLRKEDILESTDLLFDENNLVCMSYETHNAIHYGSEKLLPKVVTERTQNDTCPWKK